MMMRALAACLLAAIAGCASLAPESPDLPESESSAQDPLPPQQPQEEPEAGPLPPPVEIAPPQEASEGFNAKAAIVLSEQSPAFENVARELRARLEESVLYNIADTDLSPEEAFARIAQSGSTVVIAIGFRAAEAASLYSTVPVVFCQVFNIALRDDVSVPVKGVSAIPPLDLQVEAWKKVDPDLRSIGTILGAGHDALIAEAKQATERNGVAFHYRIAESDRETLYHFRRLTPSIDGFWLFPDNRVLSVPVLDEMVRIAGRHRVRIAVFNDALLDLGVALSTASLDTDIAEKVLSVAERITAGADAIPDLTPLERVKIRKSGATRRRAESIASGGEEAAGAAKGSL
jgi:hypothetical protein